MAILYVAEVAHTVIHPSGTTVGVTVGNAPGGGNLVVICSATTNDFLTSVTDARGNTWAIAKSATNGLGTVIAYTLQDGGALQVGDTITLNFGATVFDGAILIEAFSGIAAAPLDVTSSSNQAAGTTRDGGTTAATAQANELVIFCASVNGTETSFSSSTVTPFTTSFVVDTGSASVEGGYLVTSSTGTQHMTGTGGASLASCGITATFKGAAVGGGGNLNLNLLGVGG